MAGFFYFLDGVESPLTTEAEFREAGLWHVVCDVFHVLDKFVVWCPANKGPSGQPGIQMLVHAGVLPSVVKFDPSKQTWMPSKVDDECSLHLGWITDSPPKPDDLIRSEYYLGYSVSDSSIQQWKVPIARGNVTLPHVYTFDDSGKPQSKIKDAYLSLWETSGIVDDFVRLSADEKPDVSNDWLICTALEVLAVNYRVSKVEMNALATAGIPCLDERFVMNVLVALIDFDFAEEYAQKKTKTSIPVDQDSSNSGRGLGAA